MSAARRARFAPFGVVQPGAKWLVDGEVLGPSAFVSVTINHGSLSFADCELDPLVPPPRFRASCDGAPADSTAWISVFSREDEKILGTSVAALLVSASGVPNNDFQPPRFEVTLPPDVAVGAAFAHVINEIRQRAGLGTLEFDLNQSETAERLAPHYFAAVFGRDTGNTADTVTLGMMAGWDVHGAEVTRASFTADYVAGNDLSELIGSILMFPDARRSLLHPAARRIAVGQVSIKEPQVTAMLASTYFLVERTNRRDEARRVLAQLNRARARVGMAPAKWALAPNGSDLEAVQLLESGGDPRDATELLMDRAAEVTGTRVSGWSLRVYDLDEIRFPEELVLTPELAVVIAVGQWRAPRQPWTRYVAMVVVPEATSVRPITGTNAGH